MKWTFVAAALLIAGPAAAAEPTVPSSAWTATADRVEFATAGVSAPRRAGIVEYYEAVEFSRKGKGVDTAIKYRSPDTAVFATVYVYYPSVAHGGIQAIATDQAIRHNSNPPPEAAPTGRAAVAGVPDAAITAAYRHYLGNLFSRSAFVKAGRWMVKIRVSGPEARAPEVDGAMAALLVGLRFDGEARPRPALPIAAAECAAGERSDARLVPDDEASIAGTLLGAFDAAGGVTEIAEGASVAVPPRIGRDWCRSTLEVEGQSIAVLQATDRDGPVDEVAGKSMIFVLYSDAGRMFEVVRLKEKNRFLVLHHDVTEIKVLGAYDALPSASQLRRLFGAGGGEHTRIRATVRLRTNGDSEIDLGTPAKRK